LRLFSGAVLQGSHVPLAHGGPLLHATSQSHSDLPAFDVKAYTFRKKPRHYVAVKHKNALRIEPIIYLKTSILDSNRQVVRNWDYLRFNLDRFRENAQPKKKLSPDGRADVIDSAPMFNLSTPGFDPMNFPSNYLSFSIFFLKNFSTDKKNI
jgi:hypothetical protein